MKRMREEVLSLPRMIRIASSRTGSRPSRMSFRVGSTSASGGSPTPINSPPSGRKSHFVQTQRRPPPGVEADDLSCISRRPRPDERGPTDTLEHHRHVLAELPVSGPIRRTRGPSYRGIEPEAGRIESDSIVSHSSGFPRLAGHPRIFEALTLPQARPYAENVGPHQRRRHRSPRHCPADPG